MGCTSRCGRHVTDCSFVVSFLEVVFHQVAERQVTVIK